MTAALVHLGAGGALFPCRHQHRRHRAAGAWRGVAPAGVRSGRNWRRACSPPGATAPTAARTPTSC